MQASKIALNNHKTFLLVLGIINHSSPLVFLSSAENWEKFEMRVKSETRLPSRPLRVSGLPTNCRNTVVPGCIKVVVPWFCTER